MLHKSAKTLLQAGPVSPENFGAGKEKPPTAPWRTSPDPLSSPEFILSHNSNFKLQGTHYNIN